MDHKELGTNSSVSTNVNDGSAKFALSATVAPSRSKLYDMGSSSLGKVEAAAARPCAIIGPDRVLPPNPDDTMYLKKMPGDAWPPPDNVNRRPSDYPSKISDYPPTRNISPRQTFQENMQRIMVPPTFSSIKSSEVSNLKNTKLNMPPEAKYCDVPYNVNSVNSEHKSVRNGDIPMPVNASYPRNMPPPYGWPTGVNIRPLRPYGAQEFYQYPDFPAGPSTRQMTMIRPHRPLHEDSAQVYSERLYQDANIRFKPYPTGKEKLQQARYDYISNYPSSFHPPAPLPPHLQKSIHGHPYPVYPPLPYKYVDRRIHEPFVDGYQRSHSHQGNFNSFHSQVGPPPYGPIPGSCMQNKTYSDASSKSMNVNKMQYENNNKVYLNLEPRNKNFPAQENIYYGDINHAQAMRNEILLPTHSTLNIPPMPQHSFYRKDNTPLKPYDYSHNYRVFDQSSSMSHPLQRLPLQFSPNTIAISPDSNTSNDTSHTVGTAQEDYGYVSQSSITSIRSLDSAPHDIYRRFSYNNYDTVRNTFHPVGPVQITKNKTNSNKKNLNVRQFLSMWNEGDEEVSEANKELLAVSQSHSKNISSQNETTNSQEQLYVLGLVNVPNEELGKYDHIQKISKLPENIKGYNSIEILNQYEQYEELLGSPNINNFNRPQEYNTLSKSQIDKDITTKMPRPISPLDVEAKISQSVIHKEVGCNFEIRPCSPEMLNVEMAAPVQNILSERMIEKVINPIITKSPKLSKAENDKSQNILENAVNPASCKMISDHCVSNSSSSRIKTSSYSVQDLERNAGVCLASLPQLDNEIELNFPEINQQFIKANQIVSNVALGLQNLPHNDVDQINATLHHEIRNEYPQETLSPQLASCSSTDKEFSKLSKYRKGRKCEFSNSNNVQKQHNIKSTESITALQRIDSVIIKNPDTNKSQDIDFVNETELSYSSFENRRSIETYNLPSETAIDFSLNRSEDETAVSYLNAIDKNIHQNLPPLEAFDEGGLNEGNSLAITESSIEVQNMSTKLNINPSDKTAENSQSQHQKLVKYDKYNNGDTINQEIDDNKYDSLLKPVKSPEVSLANEEYNVLVLRNVASAKPSLSTHENPIHMEKVESIEPFEFTIPNKSKCQKLYEENKSSTPKDTKLECNIDLGEIKCNVDDKVVKQIDLSNSVQSFTHDKNKYDDCKSEIALKDELFSSKVSEITCLMKTTIDNKVVIQKDTLEAVLSDSSHQNTGKCDIKSISSNNIVKNKSSEEISISKKSSRKEEINEFESKISIISDSIELDKSEIGITNSGSRCDETGILQKITNECRVNIYDLEKNKKESASEVFQKNSEEKNEKSVMSCYTKEVCYDKNKTDILDFSLEIAKNSPQNVLNTSKIQHNSTVNIAGPGNECLSDENIDIECDKTVLLTSTETFHDDTINKKTQFGNYAQKLDVFNNFGLSSQLNPNGNYENDTPLIQEETKKPSFVFEETTKLNESSNRLQEIEDCEINMNRDGPEIVKDKGDVAHDDFIKGSCLLNESSPIKVQEKEDNEINMDIVEPVEDKAIVVYGKIVEASCSETVPEKPVAKITEFKQETKISINLGTVCKTENESKSIFDESVIKDEMVAESSLSVKNKAKPENSKCRKYTDANSPLQTDYENIFKESCFSSKNTTENSDIFSNNTITENGHKTEIDNDLHGGYESYNMDVTESELYVEEKCIYDKVVLESSFIKNMESDNEIGTKNSVQKNFKTSVSENKNLSNTCYKDEDFLFTSHEIISDHSRSKQLESEKIGWIKEAKSDINDLDVKYKKSKSRHESDMMLEKNNGSELWKCQNRLSMFNREQMCCQKELFSPWFQKLIMFTEGLCQLNTNKDRVKQVAELVNIEMILSENNMGLINCIDRQNIDIYNVDKKEDLINVKQVDDDILMLSENSTADDKYDFTENYQAIENKNMQISLAGIDNSQCSLPAKCQKVNNENTQSLVAVMGNNESNLPNRHEGIENEYTQLLSADIDNSKCNLLESYQDIKTETRQLSPAVIDRGQSSLPENYQDIDTQLSPLLFDDSKCILLENCQYIENLNRPSSSSIIDNNACSLQNNNQDINNENTNLRHIIKKSECSLLDNCQGIETGTTQISPAASDSSQSSLTENYQNIENESTNLTSVIENSLSENFQHIRNSKRSLSPVIIDNNECSLPENNQDIEKENTTFAPIIENSKFSLPKSYRDFENEINQLSSAVVENSECSLPENNKTFETHEMTTNENTNLTSVIENSESSLSGCCQGIEYEKTQLSPAVIDNRQSSIPEIYQGSNSENTQLSPAVIKNSECSVAENDQYIKDVNVSLLAAVIDNDEYSLPENNHDIDNGNTNLTPVINHSACSLIESCQGFENENTQLLPAVNENSESSLPENYLHIENVNIPFSPAVIDKSKCILPENVQDIKNESTVLSLAVIDNNKCSFEKYPGIETGKKEVSSDVIDNIECSLPENHQGIKINNNQLFSAADSNECFLPENNQGIENESEQLLLAVIDNSECSFSGNCQDTEHENTQLSPAVIHSNAIIKPRKISKRSLSESALEVYKDNENMDFIQPPKRKKLNHFLESHVITEDLSDIIQHNRRNSISTFYNEDNVYIVIDNDLILTEENDDSDKICYNENNEEFLANIESTNCAINHDLETNSTSDEPSQVCEYSDSLQHLDEKSIEDSWVDDVACIETVFSEDVAENIIIDIQASPKKLDSLDLDKIDEESSVYYDSDHIAKLKSIYGRTICNDNTQLIETLYRTPQMNVNKTLYHTECHDLEKCLDAIHESCLESRENFCTDIFKSGITSHKEIDDKENMSENENLSIDSQQCDLNNHPNFKHDNDFKFSEFCTEKQEDNCTINSCQINDYPTTTTQKENGSYSCSSSPEVSSTTSEEKSSSILLKIKNCNGSRVSQINELSSDVPSKLSYKLTEKREYRSYSSNFSSSRTLITKAAQKYIPPLKETIYDLKVKLPLPQHRLHTLKQLKIGKIEPKVNTTASVKRLKPHISKKQKPKFEDVLKSIDEINFKKHKNNSKKGKNAIPKVIIKKSENGAHYASSKTINRKDTYNPDLTGRKWQPWVFLEKNNFIDRMALQNKAKAVYCHRKNSYVLLEKFHKYKSIYNANFVISQPKSETIGNLKYTIRLKHN